jgi:hypothetical protein
MKYSEKEKFKRDHKISMKYADFNIFKRIDRLPEEDKLKDLVEERIIEDFSKMNTVITGSFYRVRLR